MAKKAPKPKRKPEYPKDPRGCDPDQGGLPGCGYKKGGKVKMKCGGKVKKMKKGGKVKC